MALLRLRGPLRRLAGDRGAHAVDGTTVADLLRGLEREFPAMRGWVLDERGVLRRHINGLLYAGGDPAPWRSIVPTPTARTSSP